MKVYKVVQLLRGKFLSMNSHPPIRRTYRVGAHHRWKYPSLAFEQLQDARRFAHVEARCSVSPNRKIHILSGDSTATRSVDWLCDDLVQYSGQRARALRRDFWSGDQGKGLLLAPPGTVAIWDFHPEEVVE